MKNWPFIIGCFAIALIVAFFYWQSRPETPTIEVTPAAPVVQQEESPVIQHPITEVKPDIEVARPVIDLEQPLPELNRSDERMAEVLSKLFIDQRLDHVFILEHFIERFVVMVDNLPRQDLPATHRPIKKIPGSFLVTRHAEELTIDPANHLRYDPLISLIETVDKQIVVAVYTQLYPLFQEAYQRLGYEGRYFNDRMVEVIDHLLGTPRVSEPVPLIQPKALYLFADPAMEEFSSGRKILIRTGPGNTERIKSILRDFRGELTGMAVSVNVR